MILKSINHLWYIRVKVLIHQHMDFFKAKHEITIFKQTVTKKPAITRFTWLRAIGLFTSCNFVSLVVYLARDIQFGCRRIRKLKARCKMNFYSSLLSLDIFSSFSYIEFILLIAEKLMIYIFLKETHCMCLTTFFHAEQNLMLWA